MYNPRSFEVEDIGTLHALIREYNFGVIFSNAEGRPMATHLPWMIDPLRGKYGTLIAHMAKANSHWKTWNEDTEALVVFQGPHAYISPAWYVEDVTVPTWNYAAVHAYGKPVIIAEESLLRARLEELIEFHERAANSDWDSRKKDSIMEIELNGIVGF